MTRRSASRLVLPACLVTLAAADLSAQGWDEPSSKKSTGGSDTPYTGFVVPTDETELDEEDDAPPAKKPAPRPAPKKRAVDDDDEAPPDPLPPAGSGIRLSDDPPPRRTTDTGTWEEQAAKPRGPAVIEVNTAAPSVVTPDDLKRDKQGIPLGSGESRRGGIGLAPKRDEDFYGTFRANDDAPARLGRKELKELEQRQKARDDAAPPPSIPSGLLVAPELPEMPDEPPPPRSRGPAAPELRITGEDSDRFRDTTPLVPGARGDGKSIKVEEFDTRSGIDTVIVAPSSKKPRREAAPIVPVIETPVVRVSPEPVEIVAPPVEEPVIQPKKAAAAKVPAPVAPPAERKPAVVVKPTTTEAPAEEDPFEKLEREKAALEGRDYDAEKAAKKAADEKKSRDEALRELSADRASTASPLAPSTPSGPAGGAGLSIGLGAGSLVLRDGTGGYAPLLAYGANVTWVPPFASFLGIDAGFWRAGRSAGSDAAFVDASHNHVALRLFLVQDLGKGVRAGVGPGLLVTASTVLYSARENGSVDQSAVLTRVGGDFTSFVGARFGIVDVRLDLRALLRGGLRLDFLPTLQVGLGF